VAEGFGMAGISLVKGFADGFSGLVRSPYKGVQKVLMKKYCLFLNERLISIFI
jgi:hypothetical protein